MEEDGKNSTNGLDMEKGKKESGPRKGVELTVRVLALVITIAAAVILGVAKQTKIVSNKLILTLPPLDITTTAKATYYLSAFGYTIYRNTIACGYTLISIAILMISKGRRSKGLLMAVLLGDLVTSDGGFTVSGTEAAGAIGLIGLKGNKHVMGRSVCDVFGKFCHRSAASLPLTLLASLVFMLLVVIDAMNLP